MGGHAGERASESPWWRQLRWPTCCGGGDDQKRYRLTTGSLRAARRSARVDGNAFEHMWQRAASSASNPNFRRNCGTRSRRHSNNGAHHATVSLHSTTSRVGSVPLAACCLRSHKCDASAIGPPTMAGCQAKQSRVEAARAAEESPPEPRRAETSGVEPSRARRAKRSRVDPKASHKRSGDEAGQRSRRGKRSRASRAERIRATPSPTQGEPHTALRHGGGTSPSRAAQKPSQGAWGGAKARRPELSKSTKRSRAQSRAKASHTFSMPLR